MGREERPARRRTFLSDTLQFMPQASTHACAALPRGYASKTIWHSMASSMSCFTTCTPVTQRNTDLCTYWDCLLDKPACRDLAKAVHANRSVNVCMVQVLAVAGALAVLGLWTLSRRGKAKQAPPPSQDVPHEALSVGNGLGARSRVRHSND